MLAGRLAAAAPRVSVLLIEYGGRAVNPLLRIPKGFYYTLRGDRYLYRYRTRPVTPGGADEVWLRGRVLGGSAAVNGMMWMRGARADWDGLAARGNRGWSWADVLPAYRAMENHSLGPSELRGAGGPLGVTVADPGDPVTAAVLAAAVGYGWDHVEDANASDAERIAFTPSTISGGRRVTSYDAYVRPALGAGRRPGGRNLAVATRTRVGRLLFDGRRCRGVRVIDRGGSARDITARREVIVCAGTVETPLLLERSGIGRPDLLRAAGIEPRIESPNVGERVIEQRGVALQVTLRPDRVAASRLSTRAGQAVEALRYLRSGRGLLATAGYDLVCQFKSAPDRPRPDVQGLFAPMALDTASAHLKLARHPGILFMAYPIRPQTVSTVHISGQDPADPPVIAPRFLEAAADRGVGRPGAGDGPRDPRLVPGRGPDRGRGVPRPGRDHPGPGGALLAGQRHRHLPRGRRRRDGRGRRRRDRPAAAGPRGRGAAGGRRLGPPGPGLRQHRGTRDAGRLPRRRPDTRRPLRPEVAAEDF